MQGEKGDIKEPELVEEDSSALSSAEKQDHTMPSMAEIRAEGFEFKQAEGSLIGELIDNQFRLTEILGKGGMSIVYKATDLILKKEVAIKLMHPHLVSDQNAYLRFKQEAQAASHLDHANVIKVYNFGMTGGENPQPFIVMDFVQGESLSETIRREGRIPVARALKIFIQVCNALAHAHGKGIIHRDLKPSNIMLVEKDGDPDYVKIVDFGIAKLLPQEGEQAARLTQTGDIFGSPTYMSPEQCRGQAVDKRSDVYALGCVIYESLSGRPPHSGTNVFETFHKHITEIPASLQIPNVDAGLSDRLEAAVFKALEKEPDKRYQSMSDFERGLQAIAQDLKSGVRGTKLGIKVVKQQRSLARFIHSTPKKALIAASVLVLLCGAVFVLWSKFSCFLSPQSFSQPETTWVEFLPSMTGRHRKHSEAKVIEVLDNSNAAIMLLRATGSRQSIELLRAWKDKAEKCAAVGAVTEEIEALHQALGILKARSEGDIEAQRADPLYVQIVQQLADCLLIQQNKIGDARPYLEETIFVRESKSSSYCIMRSPRPYLELGYTYYKLGNSMRSFERALMYIGDGKNVILAKLGEGEKSESASSDQTLAVAYALEGDVYRAMYALKHKEAQEDAKNQKKLEDEASRFLEQAEKSYRDAGKIIGSVHLSDENKLFMGELALSRAYVKLLQANYADAQKLFAEAMPYMHERLQQRPSELEETLDAYAYSCFRSFNLLKADELHSESMRIGIEKAQKQENK